VNNSSSKKRELISLYPPHKTLQEPKSKQHYSTVAGTQQIAMLMFKSDKSRSSVSK